jgi:DNA polymerase-3 subunit epsilon
VEEYAIKEQNYFIAGKGREEDEQSLVFIRNGRYAGYGFLSRYEPVNEASELSFYIKPAVWYPDADDLVRAWMKKNRGYKIIRVDEAIGTKNKG